MLVIEGGSDDVIVVSGDLEEEFQYSNSTDGDLLAFSDGTLLRIAFDPDRSGNWRITPLLRGTAWLTIEQADSRGVTDRATLDGPIGWVVQGLQHHLVKGGHVARPAGVSVTQTAHTIAPGATVIGYQADRF